MLRNLLAASVLFATACTSIDAGATEEDYVFVFLKTGPVTDVSPERTQELQMEHFANMDRLWKKGQLLISGPFGAPRVDPENRGVFVFDVPTVDEAEALTLTDPALEAGVLRLEAYAFTTAYPLRNVLPLDLADKDSESPNIRAYVLAVSEDLEVAESLIGGKDFIVFSGRFGGDLAGTVLFALDAETLDAARELLDTADPEGAIEWQLHPWYGSRHLTEI